METEVQVGNGSEERGSAQVKQKEKPQLLQFSVTEKVIFCIDASIFSNHEDNDKMFDEIFNILLLYMKLKKKISTKPVHFHCLLCSRGETSLIDTSEEKSLRNALMSLKGEQEMEEFDLSLLFDTLAKTLELPQPGICNDMMPPPFVYHCLLLFGCNRYKPVMKEPNPFYFLMKNPFFTCDTVYIYNNSFRGNNCETIGSALYSMTDVLNGYFFAVNFQDVDKQYHVFAQLLGHPLMRPPQTKAKFDIEALVSPKNVK